MQVATAEDRAVGEQPAIAAPLSVNATVPVGDLPPDSFTVNVTACPESVVYDDEPMVRVSAVVVVDPDDEVLPFTVSATGPAVAAAKVAFPE